MAAGGGENEGDGDGVTDGGARRDAALTGVVLATVAGAAWVAEAPVTVTAVVVGVSATLLAELLLSLRAAEVRTVWARRDVQTAAVVVAVTGGVGLALLVGRGSSPRSSPPCSPTSRSSRRACCGRR